MNFDDDFNNSEFADAMENIKSALFDITSTINVKLNELSNEDSEDAASFREELNARLMNIIRTSNEMLSNISAVDKYIDLDELVGEEEEDEVDLPTKEMDHIEVDEEEDPQEEEEEVDDNTEEVENVDDESTEDTEEDVEEQATESEEVVEDKPKAETPKSDLASKLNSIMASAGLDSDTLQSVVNSGNNNQEDNVPVENEDNSSDENTAVEEESTTEEVEDTSQEEETSLEENDNQVVVPSVEAPEENNEAVQEEETTSSDDNNNQVVPNVEEQEKNNEADKVSFVVNKDNKDLPKAILVTDKQYNKLLESLLSQKALCKFRNLLTTTSEIADDVNLEELMNQANDLYKNGDIKGAEEIYNKISEINASKNETN